MWLVSMVSLGVLVTLCAIGTFHAWYDDNLWQRVGMGCIVVGYGSSLIAGEEYQPLAHVGEALFAVGVAWKVWQHRRVSKPPSPFPPQPERHNWAGPPKG